MVDEGKSYKVFPLCPNIDDLNEEDKKEYGIYKKYLDVAFSNHTLRNIAITGNFGIGKSRFLRWYAKDKKFLFISGCSFMDQEKKNPGKEADSVEYNLMYQLLLGCKRRSGIFGKSYTSWRQFSLFFTLLFLLGTAFLLTLAPKLGPYLRELGWYNSIMSNWTHVGIFTGLFICLCFDAYFLIKTGERIFTLKSISLEFGSTKVEAEKEDLDSALYRNRDTLILSLVDAADTFDRTVVFEDMDRLENTHCIDLFTKLWELNQMVNLCVDKDSPIRFIYVLHDQLFSVESVAAQDEAEKVSSGGSFPAPDAYVQIKFFDYILPIVPRMSRDNAILMAKDYLPDSELIDTITLMAPHLSDYRLLKTISNEYYVFSKIKENRKQGKKPDEKRCCFIQLFKKRNSSTSSEKNVPLYKDDDKAKLLGFCIYKNLMPGDYKRIREGKSVVFPVSMEKANSDNLPDSIKLLIEKKWLDDTCLHLVGYDPKGLEACIKEAFSKKRETVLKKYWLDNESDLCGVVLKNWQSTQADSCGKIAAPDLTGVEYLFAVRALENGDLADVLRNIEKNCDWPAAVCDAKLLRQLHEGLGLGQRKVIVDKNLTAVFSFLLTLSCPELWRFVPGESSDFSTNGEAWWSLISSTCQEIEQCEVLRECCKEKKREEMVDHLLNWAASPNSREVWYLESENTKPMYQYLKSALSR